MGVTLRIEAPDWTLYEGEATPSGHLVALTSGHRVGFNFGGLTTQLCGGCGIPCESYVSTFASTLDDVVQAWEGAVFSYFSITSIEGIRATAPSCWQIYLNSSPAKEGVCHLRIREGDYLLVALVDTPFSQSSVLHASASPAVVRPGEDVIVSVWTEGEGVKVPIGGATIAGQQTNLKGEVKLKFPSPAVKRLKATRLGFIRSPTVVVTVKTMQAADEGLTVLR